MPDSIPLRRGYSNIVMDHKRKEEKMKAVSMMPARKGHNTATLILHGVRLRGTRTGFSAPIPLRRAGFEKIRFFCRIFLTTLSSPGRITHKVRFAPESKPSEGQARGEHRDENRERISSEHLARQSPAQDGLRRRNLCASARGCFCCRSRCVAFFDANPNRSCRHRYFRTRRYRRHIDSTGYPASISAYASGHGKMR